MEQFTNRFWVIIIFILVVICSFVYAYFGEYLFKTTEKLTPQKKVCVVIYRDDSGNPVEYFQTTDIIYEEDYLKFKDNLTGLWVSFGYCHTSIACHE